jgi:hypothetical protein
LGPASGQPVVFTGVVFLFGAPGGTLAWYSWPNKEMTAEELEELKKCEESLFLFDELAK